MTEREPAQSPLDAVHACFELLLEEREAEAMAQHAPAVVAEARALLAEHAALERDLVPQPTAGGTGQALAVGEQFDGFIVHRLLGEGATGEVYEAEEPSAARRVAIKLLPPEFSRTGAERVHRETQVLAALEHQGIARLYRSGSVEVGRGRRRYLAMELVRGARTVAEWRRERTRGADECVRLLADVADAVAYAHGRGVIHCDLKPGNVLVDETGRAVVIDFGISRMLDESGSAAQTVSILGERVSGTLAYLAPESLEPRARPDVRVDIHALGAMLYELLAQRPFRALDGLALPQRLHAVATTAPPRLAAASREFRGDLDRIVARATARDPVERYVGAAALAQDLRAHLAGQPVMPELQPMRERVVRALARHKVAAATAALIVAMLVATTLVSLSFARAANRDARRANLSAAARALDACDLLLVRQHVAALGADDGTPERAVLERALELPGNLVAAGDWYEAAWSPDGAWLVANGHPVENAAGLRSALVRFDRDGAEWRERWRIESVESGIGTLVASPDGTRLVDVDFEGNLRVLDAATGAVLAQCVRASAEDEVYGIAVRADGVIASANETVSLRSLERPDEVRASIAAGVGVVRALAFSPTQPRMLAVVGHDGAVLVDTEAAQVSLRFATSAEYQVCAAWSADGARLFVGSWDKTVRAYSPDATEPLWIGRGHGDAVWGLEVLDASTVASTGADGALRLWNAADGAPIAAIPISDDVAWSLQADAARREIAVPSRGGLRVQQISRLRAFGGVEGGDATEARSEDGRALARRRDDGGVDFVRAEAARTLVIPGSGPCDLVSLSPDGRLLAALRRDGTISLAETDSGTVRWSTDALRREDLHEPNGIGSIAVSPQAGLVLVASRSLQCVALSVDDGRVAWAREFGAGCVAVAVDPLGETVFAADRDGVIVRLDAHDGRLRALVRRNRTRITELAVDPRSARVLAGAVDGSLRILEPDTLEEEMSIDLGDSAPRSIRMQADGIETVDRRGVVRVR
ncbi:MAG: serine/threonine-protein kinase [Planctomycetaceae bacterium]|nr:serine/threonine-protein kinase [Planctomycetaceae bacterium]